MGVDVAGVLFSVRANGGIAPLLELLIDLGDAARTGFAPLSSVGLKCAGSWFPGRCFGHCLRLNSADPPVNLYSRCPAHLIGDVGVDVHRGGAGDVADDGGEGLDVHAVLQENCGKCMPLWHNKDKSENHCIATG